MCVGLIFGAHGITPKSLADGTRLMERVLIQLTATETEILLKEEEDVCEWLWDCKYIIYFVLLLILFYDIMCLEYRLILY